MSTISVAYFDHATVELTDDDGHIENGQPAALKALDAFLALTAIDRLADSNHIYAYYRDYHEAVGGEDWLDEQMGVPQTPEDVWTHVTPGQVMVWQDRNDGDLWHVVMEAECAWEEEHGLMLVWRGGSALTKVGGYDGHASNGDAYARSDMDDIVYAATDPKYVTRRNA